MVAMTTKNFNAFRLYDDDAGEAASTPLAAQDVNATIDATSDAPFQLRCRIDEVGGADGGAMDDYALEYSKNSGAYVALTTTDSGDGIRAVAAGLTNDAATTNRATNGISDPGGSFVAGEQSSDGIVDDMQLTANNFTEHAFGIELVSANVADSDTFDFRFSTTSVENNNVTPRVTVSKATNRVVNCTTEVLTLATNPADVNRSRVVDTIPEVLTLTENAATVGRVVIRYLNPASSGGDGTTNALSGPNAAYATLAAWQTAEAMDLVANTTVHKLICEGGTLNEQFTLGAGWTANSTYYVWITVASGSRHDGTPGTGFKISNATANFTATLAISLPGTIVEWIEAVNTQTLSDCYGMWLTSAGSSGCMFVNCIMQGGSGANSDGWHCTADDGGVLINCIAHSSGNHGFGASNFDHPEFYNCTAGNNGGDGFNRLGVDGTDPIARNCASFGNTGSDFNSASGWGAATSNNASEDSTAPGTAAQTGLASGDFTDQANDDYSIDDNTSLLYNNGADISSTLSGFDRSNYTVSIEDIISTPRPQVTTWDIGAFELISSTDRIVNCTTEVLTAATNQANVNRSRVVDQSAPEALTLAENAADVGRSRTVDTTPEVLTLVENAADVNRSRVVDQPSPEALTLATNQADVNRSRIVAGITEILALTTNPADVNRSRVVDTITEVLTLIENAATVITGANRIVNCLTEVLTAVTNSAEVNRRRVVDTLTESLVIATNQADVNRSRTVDTVPEVLTLTANAAIVKLSRNVDGITEVLVLTTNPADLNRSRIVDTVTEALTLVTNSADVTRGTTPVGLVVGTLRIIPIVGGAVRVAPRVTGTLSIRPTVKGRIRINREYPL